MCEAIQPFTLVGPGTPFQGMVVRALRGADGAPETVLSQGIPVVLHMMSY